MEVSKSASFAPGVVSAVELRGVFTKGTSRPFLVCDEVGLCWVVKARAKGTPVNVGNLLSEVVVGSLARFLGVPWPRTSVVLVNDSVVLALKGTGLDVASPMAVGTSYIENLCDVDERPEGVPFREHNLRSFPKADACSAFYGKAILDKWVGMLDQKYDQVKVTTDGSPVFLDGDTSDISSLCYPEAHNIVAALGTECFTLDATAQYLEEVLTEPALFLPWLERLDAFDRQCFEILQSSIPLDFLSEEVASALQTLLLTRRKRMLEFLRAEVSEN
jgi:hypothetical protein